MKTVTDTRTFGQYLLQSVDRAIADLRRGSAVVIQGGGARCVLAQAAETGSSAELARLRGLSAQPPVLLVTRRRAAGLGLEAATSAVPLSGILALDGTGASAEQLAMLADPTSGPRAVGRPPPASGSSIPGALEGAAIDLAKLARLLPAVVLGDLGELGDPAGWAARRGLLSVSAAEIAEYRATEARSLRIVAEARMPLSDAEDARIIAFRPSDGGVEHLALVIGEPDPQGAILTRLHSECFTGDLLGSLRCDCGDQLRGAIRAIGAAGSGVLLYLAQEGRGIGLVNKLRAYSLQDRGADTLEANEQLGFDADERVYLPAAGMLRQLGFRRVRLMTNNPDKVAALARCGIQVEERVPHGFPANRHNEPYLSAKARHFGHQL